MDDRRPEEVPQRSRVCSPSPPKKNQLPVNYGRWRFIIPSILEQRGFTNAVVHSHADPPELRRWLTEVSFQTLTEFAGKKLPKESKEAVWLSRTLEQAHEECKSGAAIHMGKLICVAQKKEA